MEYIKVLCTTEGKNVKFLLFFILTFLFSAFYMWMNIANNTNVLLEKNQGASAVLDRILNQFPKYDINENNEENDFLLYKNFLEQKDLLANQYQGLVLSEENYFTQYGIELTKMREKFYQLNDYQKYEHYFPTPIENNLERAFYKGLNQKKVAIEETNQSVMASFILLINVLAALWFLLYALLTSNILLSDYQHLSINQNFPISMKVRMWSKFFFYQCSSLVALLLICFIPVLFSVSNPLGSLAYPIAIIWNGFHTISRGSYVVLVLVYLLIVSAFVILLSMLFNLWTRNLYLSLFLLGGIFAIPHMFHFSGSIFWEILPFGYFDPARLLRQQSQLQFFPNNYCMGIIVLLFWMLIAVFLMNRTTFLSRKGLGK